MIKEMLRVAINDATFFDELKRACIDALKMNIANEAACIEYRYSVHVSMSLDDEHHYKCLSLIISVDDADCYYDKMTCLSIDAADIDDEYEIAFDDMKNFADLDNDCFFAKIHEYDTCATLYRADAESAIERALK